MKCIKCKYFKQVGEWLTDGYCEKGKDEEDCKQPYKSETQKEADSWGGGW